MRTCSRPRRRTYRFEDNSLQSRKEYWNSISQILKRKGRRYDELSFIPILAERYFDSHGRFECLFRTKLACEDGVSCRIYKKMM